MIVLYVFLPLGFLRLEAFELFDERRWIAPRDRELFLFQRKLRGILLPRLIILVLHLLLCNFRQLPIELHLLRLHTAHLIQHPLGVAVGASP